jgi:hypothetical protein
LLIFNLIFLKSGKNLKQVAWYLDDCGNADLVEKYVSVMKKYIPVDIYGPCGDLQCSEETNQVFDSYLF